MPSKKLKQRYARAEADAKAASDAEDTARKARSHEILRAILKKPVDERFDAIASTECETGLLAEDRLALLKSIRGSTRQKQPIAGGVASRLEIWHSRLRYKVFPLMLVGIVMSTVTIGAIIAELHTPQMLVELDGALEREVLWHSANGERLTRILRPGKGYYQLMKVEGDQAILKSWEPGIGYAEFKLPVNVIVRVKKNLEVSARLHPLHVP